MRLSLRPSGPRVVWSCAQLAAWADAHPGSGHRPGHSLILTWGPALAGPPVATLKLWGQPVPLAMLDTWAVKELVQLSEEKLAAKLLVN